MQVNSRTAALCAVFIWGGALAAQPRAIDTEKSVLTVRVYKAGVLSAFGHDHEIAAPVASGTVDAAAKRVELTAKTAAMKVKDPGASEKDRAQIQSTMEGPEVLDASRFPEIAFKSTSAVQAGAGAWTVHGNLSLHGQTQPVTVEVREEGGHYTGAAKVSLDAFGIKAIKVAGGTVKVKNEIRIEFNIQLAQ